jgi:hypothetical protein
MRPGHHLVVIDLSAWGALVESAKPLRPGSRIELHLENDQRRGLLRARVTRCVVAALSAETGVTYRAALSFDESCEWVCESTTHDEYDVPTTASQKPPCRGEQLPGVAAVTVAAFIDLEK